MAFPKYINPFTATFINVGTSNERLRLTSTYPLGMFWERTFLVGTECFLEDPASSTSLAGVPDEHLLASASMCAILAGGVLPGTQEFNAAIGDQSTMNFQTIVGNVKLKSNPVAVDDLTVGPPGTVFDLEFMRVGSSSNTKVVRSDAWTICQYDNRVDSVDHASYCVPGAIYKQFPTLKKSNLGEAESANRTAVSNWVASQRFWV